MAETDTQKPKPETADTEGSSKDSPQRAPSLFERYFGGLSKRVGEAYGENKPGPVQFSLYAVIQMVADFLTAHNRYRVMSKPQQEEKIAQQKEERQEQQLEQQKQQQKQLELTPEPQQVADIAPRLPEPPRKMVMRNVGGNQASFETNDEDLSAYQIALAKADIPLDKRLTPSATPANPNQNRAKQQEADSSYSRSLV